MVILLTLMFLWLTYAFYVSYSVYVFRNFVGELDCKAEELKKLYTRSAAKHNKRKEKLTRLGLSHHTDKEHSKVQGYIKKTLESNLQGLGDLQDRQRAKVIKSLTITLSIPATLTLLILAYQQPL